MSARTRGLGRIGIWAEDFDHLSAPKVHKAAAVIEDLGYGTLGSPKTKGREAMAQAVILLSATRHMTVAAGRMLSIAPGTGLYKERPCLTFGGDGACCYPRRMRWRSRVKP
ncbi:hypothetical protein ACFW3D_41720, partial [Streptomyces sp. NPDC058864]